MLSLDARIGRRGLELDAALEIGERETVALAGRSGAGKTTLLRIVAGLLRPREGSVRCGTATWLDTARAIDLAPERRSTGYLFQDYALFPHLSALDNVSYPLTGGSRAHRRERAREHLERLGVAGLAGARPGALSGGERQRVALARALARAPDALLLDEPLAALDSTTRGEAVRALRAAIVAGGAPALVVTHDFAEAARLADRIVILDGGRIVQSGTAATLAAAPATAFVADLTGAVVLRGKAFAGAGSTRVELDGGGAVISADRAEGDVAVTLHPWEISLAPAGSPPAGSARNRLTATVESVTAVGGRVRVGLAAGQPLVAEMTSEAAAELALAPGVEVIATWKATATRLVPR